jgi:ketosteroid isomerase-like protein
MLNLKNMSRGATAAAVSALMLIGAPACAEDNPKVAAEIMSIVRAQWAAETANQSPGQQLSAVADDYTEFNADYPTLLVGKPMALAMGGIAPDVKPVFSDMQNARVQVYGDTAVLTYNFAGLTRGADGKVKPATAKSTRVYVHQAGKWMLVHANFAPVHAAPQ